MEEWSPSIGQAVEFSAQLALLYLHSLGIVQRDVKPANVLVMSDSLLIDVWQLNENRHPHLADVGLAEYKKDLKRVSMQNWKSSGKPTGGFHKINMVGTLFYMAPEVLSKEIHTEKSDVYSFGVTVNELLTGVVPYTDLRAEAQAHTVLEMNYTEQQLTTAVVSEGLRPALAGPDFWVFSWGSTWISAKFGFSEQAVIQKDSHPGCTAITALVVKNKLFVANAGDCRTIICRTGKPYALSRDHVASCLEERECVVGAGGQVKWQVDTWIIGPAALQVTRSIGDDDLMPFVTAEPEITYDLMLAFIDHWNFFINYQYLRYCKVPEMCSKRLATEAAECGSEDNITVVVVFLHPVSTAERIY
ncbi:hypothetical protein DH2020_041073 [Rehmannia glutinosa]|uniref:Protein kinase domain-containing protein n=1 Tax=Rehmannia glutinosa TaxID=99300 RepID=A0ABR0USQ3_REHGL